MVRNRNDGAVFSLSWPYLPKSFHIVVVLFVVVSNVLVISTLQQQSDVKSYNDYKLLRVRPSEDVRLRTVRYLQQFADFWTDPMSAGSSIDLMVPPHHTDEVINFLISNNISQEVLLNDLQQEIDSENLSSNEISDHEEYESVLYPRKKKVAKRGIFDDIFSAFFPPPQQQQLQQQYIRTPRKVSNSDFSNDLTYPAMDWLNYHRFDTILQYLEGLRRSYPDLVELINIGTTTEGRPLVVAKVGKRSRKDKYKKPAIFIEGGIHAREWISPSTVTFILRSLVENYDSNKDIVDFYDVYILPVTNPDGYEYSHTKDRMWRKTRSANSFVGALIDRCVGVDLNRNFNFHWGGIFGGDLNSGNRIACTETYSGPKPFSEPESRALRDFVWKLKDDLVMYLSYHSYGEKVIYPWSFTTAPIADWEELQEMGEVMAKAIYDETDGEKVYSVGQGPTVQYLATGGTDDWVKGVARVKWVFLIELPDAKYGFLLPKELIGPAARSGMAAMRAAAAEAGKAIVRRR